MSKQEFKRMSKGQFQMGTQSGRRTLERCNKGKTKNFVYVDVENGESHDYIFIDAPEFSQENLQDTSLSANKLQSGNFINIEDDEIIVDETENGDKVGEDQDAGGTSSKSTYPAFRQSQSSKKSNNGEFQSFHRKRSPVKYTKSRRTYSEKTYPRNRFGFGPLGGSLSSDSDSSDCELMEGSSGIREQWERAALKRKKIENSLNDHSGLDNEASGSRSHMSTPKTGEVGNTAKQHEEAASCSTSKDDNYEKMSASTSTASDDDDGIARDTFLTPEVDMFSDLDKSVGQDSPSPCRSPLWEDAPISHRRVDLHDKEKTFQGEHSSEGEVQGERSFNIDADLDSSSVSRTPIREEAQIFCKKVDSQERGKTFQGENSSDAEVQVDGDDNNDEPYKVTKESKIPVESQLSGDDNYFQEVAEAVSTESLWSKYEEKVETHVDAEKSSVQDEELHTTERSQGTYANCERVISPETCFSNIQSPNSANYESGNFSCKEKPFFGEPSLWSNQPYGKMHGYFDPISPSENDESHCGECFFHDDNIQHKSEVFHESVTHQDNEQQASDNLSPNFPRNETHVNYQMACSMDEKELAFESDGTTLHKIERSLLHGGIENDAHDAVNNIIGEREKLKETDEYKRAAEEEWASRQQQLQLQAEEAQRLRKRKRAETQRLLDMERRQRERLEEMRETQKKIVETINMKEELRSDVRKELDRLELIHTDMVSLLRALGIRVGSGFYPTSSEVNAAYKQALLKFHPDRATKTGIRQQVEAEEKFKLVSRLKEKLTNSKPNYF